MRIWRIWLQNEGYDEKDHFVTANVYLCVELNCHLLINLVHNVKNGIFPVESLRLWLLGSQGCEELYRILRAMTPMFSTMLNFTVKGILQRIHKLNHLSTRERDIIRRFQRVKRRLLQYKEESDSTFDCANVDIIQLVFTAKQQAIISAKELGMTYVAEVIDANEEEDVGERGDESEEGNEYQYEANDVITINEDCSNLRVHKKNQGGFPVYEKTTSATGTKRRRIYSGVAKTKGSPFMTYKDMFIRKTTALYLIQEKVSVSNDRLFRVRRGNYFFVLKRVRR